MITEVAAPFDWTTVAAQFFGALRNPSDELLKRLTVSRTTSGC